MSRRMDRVREALLGNATYKLLAAAFTLMVWIWVQSEQVVEERARVRLDWKLPDGLTTVEPPLQTATVTVEGVQAFVRAVHQRELSIDLDLSRAKEGEVDLDLSERAIAGLPGQVRVVSISPSSLKLRLDRIQKRRVPIVAATRGEPAEGWRVVSVKVTPERTELRGPSSVLRGLEEVQTDAVDLAGLREDAEFTVGLAVRQGQLTPTTRTSFVVTVDLEPMEQLRELTEIPVLVRAEGWASTVPNVTVVVEGPKATIDALDPDGFSVVASVPDGYAEPTASATRNAGDDAPRFEVIHPEGEAVRIVRVEPEALPLERR